MVVVRIGSMGIDRVPFGGGSGSSSSSSSSCSSSWQIRGHDDKWLQLSGMQGDNRVR